MKKKKLFYLSILIVLGLILAIFVFVGRYTDRVIDPYVRSLLEVSKPMNHTIEYKKIGINLFQRSILIKKVKMFPDSSLTHDALRMEIAVEEIRLTEFSLTKMLFNKTLSIRELLIENPEVILTLPDKPDVAIKKVREKKSEKKGSRLLRQIQLDQITFSGGIFQLIHNEVILARAQDIRLLARAISLIQNSREEPVGFSYGDIALYLSDIEFHSETGLYTMSLEKFSITKCDSTIVLDGFRMIPKYDKQEFSRKLEFQNDRFDLQIGVARICGIGIERFRAGEPLEISSILIDDLKADIYRDKNVPMNHNRYPPFYNESFLKIPVPLCIDTVVISNSRIQYGELTASHPVAGTIFLDQFGLQIYHLTNQKIDGTPIPEMQIHVRAMVMGEGLLKAKVVLPLEGNMHEFSCSGSVGAMQLKPLNDMLEPATNIRFKGGKVNRMTFAFTANDNASTGWMEFLYQNLDVELLKKMPGKKKGFVSFLANWVAVSNNPVDGKDLKIVEIGYERDKNKGIINYIWKTIQSGMVHTIIPLNKYKITKKKPEKKKTRAKG